MTAFATLWGLGRVPAAPGTAGSLAALPLVWALFALGSALGPGLGLSAPAAGFALCLAGFAAASVFGWIAAAGYLEGTTETDPSEIVVDELAGQMLALMPLPLGLALRGSGADILALWPGWVGAFVAFRLFDIWKPWPISALDRMPGVAGVMLDDLAAGLVAALVVTAAAAAAHGWLT
ncbi:MAG: phosphatidylglycerophosphatase A [Paracoccaceae bacterium]